MYKFTTGLQNDHKSIMKLIEEKIYQLHEEARNKQNIQTNKGEQDCNRDSVSTYNTHVCNGGVRKLLNSKNPLRL